MLMLLAPLSGCFFYEPFLNFRKGPRTPLPAPGPFRICTPLGVEYIFHVAAAFRQEKATDDDYRLVHLHSTQVLAKAVTGQENFKCFVHVSTVGVHGHIEIEKAAEAQKQALAVQTGEAGAKIQKDTAQAKKTSRDAERSE